MKDKKNLKIFLVNCPKDTQIYYIDTEEAKYHDFKSGDKRYFLNLEKYEYSFDNYLRSFNKKHRKNLNYDLRKLGKEGYVMERNKIEDFEKLVELNIHFQREVRHLHKAFGQALGDRFPHTVERNELIAVRSINSIIKHLRQNETIWLNR